MCEAQNAPQTGGAQGPGEQMGEILGNAIADGFGDIALEAQRLEKRVQELEDMVLSLRNALDECCGLFGTANTAETASERLNAAVQRLMTEAAAIRERNGI